MFTSFSYTIFFFITSPALLSCSPVHFPHIFLMSCKSKGKQELQNKFLWGGGGEGQLHFEISDSCSHTITILLPATAHRASNNILQEVIIISDWRMVT